MQLCSVLELESYFAVDLSACKIIRYGILVVGNVCDPIV